MQKPELGKFKIVDEVTGNMVAWAGGGFPYSSSEEEKMDKEREREREKMGEDAASEWPKGANLEVCEAKCGGLERLRNEHVDWKNTYVIYLLEPGPAYQRKDLASMLLKHGLDLANREEREVYIGATPEGHPVCLEIGFKEIEVLALDLSRWGGEELGINPIMMRDPNLLLE